MPLYILIVLGFQYLVKWKTSTMATQKYLPNFAKDSFETSAWSQNRVICGVDEVGRGCLAGPLVVAAAILPANPSYRLLKNSKGLSAKELQLAYHWIKKNCIYSVVPLHHRAIDAHNIYHATLIAMKRAIMQICAVCPQLPAHIVVDAMPLKLDGTSYQDIPVAHFINGERKSRSIAAASIVAKVYRDRLITRYSHHIPGYHLEQHKGYCTLQHKTALWQLGKSFIHRTTFLSKVPCGNKAKDKGQQSLC